MVKGDGSLLKLKKTLNLNNSIAMQCAKSRPKPRYRLFSQLLQEGVFSSDGGHTSKGKGFLV